MRDMKRRTGEQARGRGRDAAGPEQERDATRASLAGLSFAEGAQALSTRSAGEAARAVSQQGLRGSGGRLPHLERVQAAFGSHDISGITAHQGGAARDATGALGAAAFARGEAVAFAGSPTLRTVAHEAAHVVQQRAGASVPDGLGMVGDDWERHADAVADAVARGESAAPLLDSLGSRRGARARNASAPVQLDSLGFVESWQRFYDNYVRPDGDAGERPICGEESPLRRLEAGLGQAERAMGVAQHVASGAARQRIQTARGRVGQVRGVLSSAGTLCDRERDVRRILSAASTLNSLGDFSRDREKAQQAAAAFGELFVGLGGFVSMLPAPVGSYSTFFQEMGPFFSNVLRNLDPLTMPNGHGLRDMEQRPGHYGRTSPESRQGLCEPGSTCW